jgi:hypothetical protein
VVVCGGAVVAVAAATIVIAAAAAAAAAVALSQFLQFMVCKKYLYKVSMYNYNHIYPNVRCCYTNTQNVSSFVHDYKATHHFSNGELKKLILYSGICSVVSFPFHIAFLTPVTH